MPDKVSRLFLQHGVPALEAALRKWIGKSSAAIKDQQAVALLHADAWQSLPIPLRVLGKERLEWEDLFRAAFEGAFVVRGPVLTARDDLRPWLETTCRKVFQAGEPVLHSGVSAPAPAPAMVWSTPPVVVGIDLGTTYSVIAYLDDDGRPISISNELGDLLTPSAVFFDRDSVLVGKEAIKAGLTEPENLAVCVKRDMGAQSYRKTIRGESLPPQVISAYVLRTMKDDAERKLGRPVREAVVTVPAYFDEPRRQATVEAGRLAGLEVLDIINEPTAAAVAYGFQMGFLEKDLEVKDRPLRVLVFDLGGGTFDVTILEIRGSAFTALATDGDMGLGGKDWDEKLVELAAAKLQREFGEVRQDAETEAQLWVGVEEAKKSLGQREHATLYLQHRGKRVRVELTRAEFEAAAAPLVLRTRTTVEIVLREAGMNWSAIDRVLLIGGSTRLPMIREMLKEITGRQPDHTAAVDEAVAHGAALYADLISRRRAGGAAARFSLTNVNSHSLGIVGLDKRSGQRRNYVLIPKHTRLPCSRQRVFPTARTNQASVKITVVEGESERPENCSTVGTCFVRNLPPNLPAGAAVEVCYAYAENGRLEVSARLQGNTHAVAATFDRDSSLPEESLRLWAEVMETVGDHR